jgi:hypothetical protein
LSGFEDDLDQYEAAFLHLTVFAFGQEKGFREQLTEAR